MTSQEETRGVLFNIQRFSIYDGPGIRTCVFFKGCPLQCQWCHNPEGIGFGPEIAFMSSRCAMCGRCAQVCTAGAHVFEAQKGHWIDRTKCVRCAECVDACAYGALEKMGIEYTAAQVMKIVMKDLAFYGQDGGMTLTGGEPMAQPRFARALAELAWQNGIDVCMETSGHCDRTELLKIAPFIHYFLFDCKETRADKHVEFTGVYPDKLWANLKALDENGSQIILRCPLIPDRNTHQEHYDGIARLASNLHNLVRVELEPYHAFGLEKRERLGVDKAYARQEAMPKPDAEAARAYIQERVKVPVIVA